MEEQSVKTGGMQSELCCIIFAVLIIVFQYYVYGSIDPLSYYFLIFVFFIIGYSIYYRSSIRRRVYSHLLHFSNGRIAIQKVMTDLQLGFFDAMAILEELKKKKKIPIEIEEKSGEIIVGKIDKKPKLVTSDKLKTIAKPMKPKEEAIEDKKITKGKIYKCSNCGQEIRENYKYCPGCGNPFKKED